MTSNHVPLPTEELYAALVRELLSQDPEISTDTAPGKKRFGFGGELKTAGKMFAFLSKGRLVLKLPRQRVDELTLTGEGHRYDPGQGRLMKEWVSVGPDLSGEWLALAVEAKRFVDSKR